MNFLPAATDLAKTETRSLLWRGFRAHYHERAGGRASWTGDRPLVHQGHSTSARPAVSDDEHLVLITFPSARCCRAVEAHHTQRALSRCRRWASRPGRALCAPWPRWSRWARRTGFALLTRRSGRAGVSLRTLSGACYANRKRDRNGDAFHTHQRLQSSHRPGRRQASGATCERAGGLCQT